MAAMWVKYPQRGEYSIRVRGGIMDSKVYETVYYSEYVIVTCWYGEKEGEGQSDKLEVSVPHLNFSANGGTQEVQVQSQSDWTVINNLDWFSAVRSGSKVVVTVGKWEQPTNDFRGGNFIVNNGTSQVSVSVVQRNQ